MYQYLIEIDLVYKVSRLLKSAHIYYMYIAGLSIAVLLLGTHKSLFVVQSILTFIA